MQVPDVGETVTLTGIVAGTAGHEGAVAAENHWVTVHLSDGQTIQTNLANLNLHRRPKAAPQVATEWTAEEKAEPDVVKHNAEQLAEEAEEAHHDAAVRTRRDERATKHADHEEREEAPKHAEPEHPAPSTKLAHPAEGSKPEPSTEAARRETTPPTTPFPRQAEKK